MRSALRIAVLVPLLAAATASADQRDDLATLRSLTGVAATPPEAQAAWARLAAGGPATMPKVLSAMKGADPVSQNWLRLCADTIGEAADDAGRVPIDQLRVFLADTGQAPRARRTAYEWIVRVKPEMKADLLASMLADPSLELRYDAVAQLLAEADEQPDRDAKLELYSQALPSARNAEQLKTIKKALADLGEEVDLVAVMGFLKLWSVVGPFDNADQQHFDTAYPPEEQIDTAAEYDGMSGRVGWEEVAAGGEGVVDLLKTFGKQPNAIAYACTTFTARGAGEAELRYSSKNATKVWLNGELIASNEVYHSGTSVDQYKSVVQLREGENALLVKVCQNAQKMPWEKEWDFRLRVVDKLGTPVGFQEEPASPTSTEPSL